MKLKQRKPPACLDCAKPCWRDGYMAELHMRHPGPGELPNVSVCMYCSGMAAVEETRKGFRLRPLTEGEAEQLAPAMAIFRANFARKRALVDEFGGNIWDY